MSLGELVVGSGRGPVRSGGPLLGALEDLDDVQNVFANFDVSDDVLAALDA